MTSAAFAAWCKDVGVVLGNCEAAYVGEGAWRGIVATASIQPGDILVAVPERLLLSRASADRDPDLGPLLEQHQGLNSYQVLGIHLLHEVAKAAATSQGRANASCRSKGSGQTSFWQPYLEELPRSYTTLCCFSTSDVSALQVPYAQKKAQAAAEKAEQEWQGALPLLKQLGLPKKYCGISAWLWASSTLLSRTMYVPWDEAGCLMPYGDLHNYQPPPPPHVVDVLDEEIVRQGQTGIAVVQSQVQEEQGLEGGSGSLSGNGSYDAHDKMYKLYARRQYNKGEQVFLCYGRHSNIELLDLYGFLLEDLTHDMAMVPKGAIVAAMAGGATKLTRNAHDVRQQGPVYTEDSPSLPQLYPSDSYLHPSGSPSWQLLQALRTAAASPHERKAFAHKLAANERVSLAGDLRVLEWLADTCLLVLASLPSSVSQDEQAMKELQHGDTDFKGPSCLELAMQWRLCYKRTLLEGARRAHRGLKVLQKQEHQEHS